MGGRGARHAWAWQMAFTFSARTQVCCRMGCGWRRKRVEVKGNRRGIKSRVTRWAYASEPGKPYRLLLSVPRCPGFTLGVLPSPRGKAAARRRKKLPFLWEVGESRKG